MLAKSSKLQDNDSSFIRSIRTSLRYTTYLLIPTMIGLITVARPAIIFLLTDKWDKTIIFMQLFCILFMIWPITTILHQGILAKGKSKFYLYSTIIVKAINLIVLLSIILLKLPIVVLVVSEVFIEAINLFIAYVYFNKICVYDFKYIVSDIMPSLIMSLVMMASIYWFRFIIKSNLILLITQISIGFIIYLVLSILTKNESFAYIKKRVFEVLNKSNTDANISQKK